MRHHAEARGIVRVDVFTADGLYEKIVIRDIPYRGRTARILLQDLNVSGGLVLDDGSMAFDYTRYFDLYRLFTPELKTALAIGGGAYSVPGPSCTTPRARSWTWRRSIRRCTGWRCGTSTFPTMRD